jgi:hypothetical protein
MLQLDLFELRFEAVAARLAASLQAEHANIDDLRAMQCHQAVRRAHEVDAGPAVCQLVAHHLRDRQPVQRLLQRTLKANLQRSTFGQRTKEDGIHLAI